MALSAYVGMVAAFCTTVAFVPQIIKLRKQGGEDLSYPMLFLYLTGVLLWFVYGIQVHAVAVIWANALAGLMVFTSIVLKANPPKRALGHGRRLRIAVDMDEVIADSFSRHLRRYNEQAGERLTRELIASRGLHALIPRDRRDEFAAIPHADGFFADLDVIPGSREALAELSRHHDVYIASAAMEVPSSFDDKFKWLKKNFPFIPPARIIFCGDKQVLDVDVLIDDRSRHFQGFRGLGILFSAPHNAGEAAPLRANSWDDVLRIVLGEGYRWKGRAPVSRSLSMNPAES